MNHYGSTGGDTVGEVLVGDCSREEGLLVRYCGRV